MGKEQFDITKEEMAIIVGENVDRLCSIEIRPRMPASGVFPALYDAARKKYPGVEFRVHDILEEDPGGNYDYALLSGAFNPRLSDNWSFIRMMVSKMYEICNYSIAFNMFSDKVDYLDEKIHYQNRDQLRDFCKTLTDNIIERDDYMRFGFTVYLYKKS